MALIAYPLFLSRIGFLTPLCIRVYSSKLRSGDQSAVQLADSRSKCALIVSRRSAEDPDAASNHHAERVFRVLSGQRALPERGRFLFDGAEQERRDRRLHAAVLSPRSAQLSEPQNHLEQRRSHGASLVCDPVSERGRHRHGDRLLLPVRAACDPCDDQQQSESAEKGGYIWNREWLT